MDIRYFLCLLLRQKRQPISLLLNLNSGKRKEVPLLEDSDWSDLGEGSLPAFDLWRLRRPERGVEPEQHGQALGLIASLPQTGSPGPGSRLLTALWEHGPSPPKRRGNTQRQDCPKFMRIWAAKECRWELEEGVFIQKF